MKSFILKFTLFCGILLTGVLCFHYFITIGQRNYDSNACYKLRHFLSEKSIDPEIVIFGSSVAEGGVSPQILIDKLGVDVFNAALSGRRIIDWQSIAFSFLDYTENNKVLILDIFPNVFNESQNLYQPHEFYPYLRNQYVKKALAPVSPSYKKLTSIPFYYLTHLNSKIILNSLVGIRDLVFKPESSIPNNYLGFHNVNLKFNSGKLTTLIPSEISPRSLSLYEKIFKQAYEKKITVVLVGMPVYFEGRKAYENIEDIYSIGKEWAIRYPNLLYLDLSRDSVINNDKSYFANNTHMNVQGANYVTEKIAGYIKENQLITRGKND